jgi:hypothetical protein
MLEDIKRELINKPEKLKSLLEYYCYENIKIRDKYIQFGRDEYSSQKSITIKLDDNPYLYVKDWARNISQDLINYIIEQRKVEFIDVMNSIKTILGIIDYYNHYEERGIFGGIYNNIRKIKENKLNTYNNNFLNSYNRIGNLRFLRDNISLETQKYFEIGYDIETQGITIPIRSQLGELIGVKIRVNYDVEDGEQKYYYLLPCAMSKTLFGYSQNYKYLVGNTIYIFESEKSVMQCYSYGIRNCVALGSGSISNQQVKMILELNPKSVIFMHDYGYEFENIIANINKLKRYSRFNDFDIGYWDWKIRKFDKKYSPSDLGKDILIKIIENEIKIYNGKE